MSEFSCKKCGAECPTAPSDGSGTICEDCCEDHDYRYCRDMGEHRCKHCDKPAPLDWYDND